MEQINTPPIDHGCLIDEAHFIAGLLRGLRVDQVAVCCAFGVDPDDPLFGRETLVEVGRLVDYLLDHERAGTFRLGQTNITLTTRLEGLEFRFGNDRDVICRGVDSPEFRRVLERWSDRYSRDR